MGNGSAPSGPNGGAYALATTGSQPSSSIASTTNFVDDKQTASLSIRMPTDIQRKIGEASTQAIGLAEFLAKPVHVDDFSWSTSDATLTLLATGSLEGLLSTYDVWAKKLEGFRYVRGTFNVRLNINANPMQQGKLVLHFLPFYGNAANGTQYDLFHTTTRNGITQGINIELDCRQTGVEMKIPYISPTQWYDLVDDEIGWGKYSIYVLSPLMTGTLGATTVSGQTWVSLEDAEFMGPTEPQMSRPYNRARVFMKGAKAGADAALKESISMESGPVTKALGRVSAVASSLIAIPELSAFAAPVAWVTGVAASIASVFGWSKPNFDKTAAPMLIRPTRNFGNAQGESYGEPLALISDPRVTTLPGFAGTDIDEMSFNFLKTIPAFIYEAGWDTSDAKDTTIFQAAVGPANFYEQEVVVGASYTNTLRHYIPASYVAKVFRHWRGSVNFHFKFVKTGYHSGRLVLDFVPGDSASAPTQSSYNLREVIDISESNEYVFNVPYMLNYVWADFGQRMGYIRLSVLSELTAPEAVSNEVQLLVYASAGSDFEVCSNIPTQTFPTIPQMDVTSAIAASKIMGNAKPSGHAPDILGQYTTGEYFTSIKQLVTKYCKTPIVKSTTGIQVIWPKTITTVNGTQTATPTVTRYGADWFSYFAGGYALYRGGTRFYFSSLIEGTQPIEAYTSYSGSNTSFGATPLNNQATGTAFVPLSSNTSSNLAIFNRMSDGVEVILPYGNTCVSSLCTSYNDIGGDTGIRPTDQSQPDVFLEIFNLPQSTDSVKMTYWRAMAEDFQFGYFIGFPGLLVSHTINP